MARKPDPNRKSELALAAFAALRARGVVGMTMSEIAVALGMKRPALYYYFRDLGELFDAVLTAVLADQSAYVLTELNVDDHPIDVLATWMRATLAFYEADPQLIGLLLQFWAVGRPDAAQEVLDRARDQIEPVRQFAIAILEAAVRDGRVGPCAPEAMLDLCVAVVDGCLVERISRGLDPRPTLELFISQVLIPLKITPL
jgi:AcrR family transcriptional regulator